MSLSEFLTRNSNNKSSIPSVLAKVCSILEHNNDTELFTELYNTFSGYSLELTISPKSSSVLQQPECATCGRASLRDASDQVVIMENLITELIKKFKINILGVIEEYKDGKHIHSHNIMSPVKEYKRKNIKEYIKSYYKLDNNYLVNIKPIQSKEKYKQYMLKETKYEYYYHNNNKELSIEKIEEEIENKKSKKENQIYGNPIKLHLSECIFDNCPICQWIYGSENVSQSDQTVIR